MSIRPSEMENREGPALLALSPSFLLTAGSASCAGPGILVEAKGLRPHLGDPPVPPTPQIKCGAMVSFPQIVQTFGDCYGKRDCGDGFLRPLSKGRIEEILNGAEKGHKKDSLFPSVTECLLTGQIFGLPQRDPHAIY